MTRGTRGLLSPLFFCRSIDGRNADLHDLVFEPIIRLASPKDSNSNSRSELDAGFEGADRGSNPREFLIALRASVSHIVSHIAGDRPTDF